MSSRKSIIITLAFVIAVSLISSSVAALLIARQYSSLSFEIIDAVLSKANQQPETQNSIASSIKEYARGNADDVSNGGFLSDLGYRESDFFQNNNLIYIIITGFTSGISIFLFAFLYRTKEENRRIRSLAEYLAQVNSGKAMILSSSGEDEFSKLEDEIYKTVTYLYQTKAHAVQTRNDFAENLSNIAHQIKTPITSLSLAIQKMKRRFDPKIPEQMEQQLSRLTYLEESLLVLSRLDAGTLVFSKEETDVFTLLTLAADNLRELFSTSATAIDIPENGEIPVIVDADWTMEAIMNIMKNCMEHNKGGTVYCSYTQNPLYTEILIWDEGDGLAKEDIPHLFERFYRGKNASEGGIGIGLALAKEIIERQNGTIRARNKPGDGALFEIRFYCH